MSIIDELVTNEKLILDVIDAARAIDYEFADYFIQAPCGIYSANQLEPIIVPNKMYYTIEKENNKVIRKPIKTLDNVVLAVYTEGACSKDMQVIPSTYMKNKEKYLSLSPIIPYWSVKLVDCLISEQLDRFVKYKNGCIDYDRKMRSMFIDIDDESYINTITRVRELYEEIHVTVNDFIKNYSWYLFFKKLKVTKVTIERSIDYRAYRYLELTKYKNE